MKGFVVMLAICITFGAFAYVEANNNPKYSKESNAVMEALAAGQTKAPVRKASSGLITKGTPVVFKAYTTAYPGYYTVESADANDATLVPCIGIMQGDVSTSEDADCVTSGIMTGLDTSSYSAGTVLYLSETVGTLTATAPSAAGSFVQPVAIVLRKDAKYGVINVIANGRVSASATNALPLAGGTMTGAIKAKVPGNSFATITTTGLTTTAFRYGGAVFTDHTGTVGGHLHHFLGY